MSQYARLLAVAATLLLAACSLQSVAPEKTVYQFSASRPAQAAAPTPLFGALRVNDFRADQVNRTASLVYRETDQRYVADPYRLFVAPPAILLTERTRNWLATSGLFRNVVPAGALLSTDTILDGELIELHVDVRDPKHPAAILTLRAWLVDAKGAALRPEWRFSQRIALNDASSASAAAGFDRAITAALADLETTFTRQ